MKQTVIYGAIVCGLATFISCGNSNTAPSPATIYPHRAFISNLTGSRIDIADTTRDLLVSAISGDTPGLMQLSHDKKFTVAVSATDNALALVVNSSQGVAGTSILGGATQSLVSTVDNATILAAVPTETGPVGQAPGAVDVITATIVTSGTTTAATLTRQPSIFLPGARYLAASPNTNGMLAMSDSVSNPANPGGPAGRVWAILPSLVNSNTQPYQEAVSTLWDHPVFAIGSTDNLSAYVLNCGAECGGTQASIVQVTFPNPPASTVPVVVGQLPIPGGATVAFISGNTMYVAGTVAGIGTLTIVDIPSFAVTGSVAIADGYHDRITLGANNLLFVGARGCSIDRTSTPQVGCLTLFDTMKLTATIAAPTPFTAPAPDPGDDVTGMTPIANRNEVYVAQGGELIIYDTTTGLPKVLSNPPNIVGQAVEVVAIDF